MIVSVCEVRGELLLQHSGPHTVFFTDLNGDRLILGAAGPSWLDQKRHYHRRDGDLIFTNFDGQTTNMGQAGITLVANLGQYEILDGICVGYAVLAEAAAKYGASDC